MLYEASLHWRFPIRSVNAHPPLGGISALGPITMKHNIRIPQDLLHGLLGRAGIARRLSGGTPLIDSPVRWKNDSESRSLARMPMDAAKTMAMRIGASGIWRWKQRIAGLALLASVGPVASPAMAQTLVKSNVLDGGYTGCSYSVQGDTVSIKFKTRFNPASGHTNDAFFAGRVLLINTYDASGKPIPISPRGILGGIRQRREEHAGDALPGLSCCRTKHRLSRRPMVHWARRLMPPSS